MNENPYIKKLRAMKPRFAGLKYELEEELGVPVDLVTVKSLKHPLLRKSILEEAQDV